MDNNAIDLQQSSITTKYCKHCGKIIPEKAVICLHCGCQVEELKQTEASPSVVINNTNESSTANTNANINTNTNVNTNVNKNVNANVLPHGTVKNKWVAFFLCLFFGCFGIHKFYEGKIGMGVLYLFTGGLLGFGWIIDTFALLFKPNPYYI